MPTMREHTTKKERAYTREVSPPSKTWRVPPHPSLARMKRDLHTAPSGDLSVLHPLQHQLIWVGGKPMDDPEQSIAEARVLLGLRTQPGPYLRNHEDIGIPAIPFNEYLTINVKMCLPLHGWSPTMLERPKC